MRAADRFEVALLMFDAIVLAVLELFFLMLRFDGTLLPQAGGWPFPVTALLAAVTVPLLVRRASRISPRGLVAGAPLYSWLLVVVLLGALSGPGGDVLLMPDWRPLLLIAAGLLPGAVALGTVLGTVGKRG
ncbi:MAG: hypothetical protein ACRDRN_13790 [Sciscionella sp.]